MTALPLRLALVVAAVAALAGCSGERWPAPKRIGEIRLRDDRREPLATVALGDALHIVFPPPIHPGSRWTILLLNTRMLRQMTAIKPAANAPPGSEEVTFQAIKVTGRTTTRFAALNPESSDQNSDDLFTVNIGIPRASELFPAK